jgi:hypothetical protein
MGQPSDTSRTANALKIPGFPERGVRGGNRRAADVELARKLALGWQSRANSDSAVEHQEPDALGERRVCRASITPAVQ